MSRHVLLSCAAMATLAACGWSRRAEPPPEHVPVMSTLFEATPAHYGIIDAAVAEGGAPVYALRFDPETPFGEGGVEVLEITGAGDPQRIWRGDESGTAIAVSDHHVWVLDTHAQLTAIERAAPHRAMMLDGQFTHLVARGEHAFTSSGRAAPTLTRLSDEAPSTIQDLGVRLETREALALTPDSLVYRPIVESPMRMTLPEGAPRPVPCESCRPSGDRWYAPDWDRHAFVEVADDGTRGRTLAERVEDLRAPIVIGESGVLALELDGYATGPFYDAHNHVTGELVFTQLGTGRRAVVWNGELGAGPHQLVPIPGGAILVTAQRIARVAWR